MDEKLQDKRVIFANSGLFGLFKAHRDTEFVPEMANDEISRNGICEFEFGTIKTTYTKDIYDKILDKHREKPPKGVFSALKVRRGHKRVSWGQK